MVSNLSLKRPITKNLITGEKILKSFQSEYPYCFSNTKLNLKIQQHAKQREYSRLLGKLNGKSQVAGLKISNIRTFALKENDKISFLKKAVHNQRVANCGEYAALISDELENKNIPYKNVLMKVFSHAVPGKERLNHKFSVIGLNKDADISNPKTWGKNAVIIDAWANIVKRASEGLDYINQLFNLNSKKDFCEFTASKKYL